MSYQVLARKWRPRSFASLVGQEHVVRALTHALTAQRLHHAYLFTGTRGVGKTTLARILAKALNCETGITATPCGTCSACREIDAGRFVDLLEVDAATNTKVDEMRQLLENAVYAPTRGRFKVYVIDEVHMLSTSAFNAMLKTLEEPPQHVKFILATTDPQKIPVTVLSRCLQFNLKQMTQPLITSHLKHILEVEAIDAEIGALHLLARSAAGSMRDALSLLDQAIAHGSGEVEEAQVREMLGAVDLDHLFSITDALLAGDAPAMLRIADEMAARSLSFDAALQEMASLFTRLQIAQLAPQAIPDELPERSTPARPCRPIRSRIHPARLPDCRARPPGVAAGARRAGRFHHDPVAAARLPAAARRRFGRTPATRRQAAGRRGDRRADPSNRRRPSRRRNRQRRPRRRHLRPRQPCPGAHQPAAPLTSWHDILGALKIGGMARELAQHCELRDLGPTRIVLHLSPAHRHLLMKPAQDKLQQSLSEYFARPLQLVIDLAEGSGDTPAAAAQRNHRERMDRAIASVEQDGFVREVIEMFDATLVESSIKPI
jgi:DNA polymerase-3 subunit gamma/tau